MARPNTHVPSVEDMRKLYAAREVAKELGLPTPALVAAPVLVPDVASAREQNKKITAMRNKVDDLAARAEAQRRRTPTELRESLLALFERDDFSPAAELYQMYRDRDDKEPGKFLTADQRIKVLSELTSYVMSKIKSVEVKGRIDHEHKVTIVKFAGQTVPVHGRSPIIEVGAERTNLLGEGPCRK